jgi:phenylpropionate dioxygenase-like ring-hydroxylating dioxygenase large terminal subunit
MNGRKAFPLNAWYAAAWGGEIQRDLAARKICDQDIVLYRRTDGQICALENAGDSGPRTPLTGVHRPATSK